MGYRKDWCIVSLNHHCWCSACLHPSSVLIRQIIQYIFHRFLDAFWCCACITDITNDTLNILISYMSGLHYFIALIVRENIHWLACLLINILNDHIISFGKINQLSWVLVAQLIPLSCSYQSIELPAYKEKLRLNVILYTGYIFFSGTNFCSPSCFTSVNVL